MPSVPAIATPISARAAEMLLRWPRGVPLAALVSGGEERAHNAWSVFARPRETVVIDGNLPPAEAVAQLGAALARTPRPVGPGANGTGMSAGPTPDTAPPTATGATRGTLGRTPPFDGGWIVALGYSLGRCFETSVRSDGVPFPACDRPAPHAVLLWCEDAWCLDHSDGSLHSVGAPPPLERTAQALAWRLDGFAPDTTDAAYARSVARAVEYIHAGDAFQSNIARRYSARFSGDARAFAHAAISENHAWFGASLELGSAGHLVSMSPELFLRATPDGAVVTRPIKGTRPSDVNIAELESSEKDSAELAMIVDLMRNDLGRVAMLGSVRVTTPRVLETHRTVHHGVAEVSARLDRRIDWLELLKATFPPGSVTGAPKIRAMEIIEELEAHPRGFYCGAIGYIARSGHAALNVAIRTARVGPEAGPAAERCLSYFAGCGIVADSDPADELRETYAKARAIAQLASAPVSA